ncbi:MAG: Dabb family protein, partial [Oscillospiraceae bacterium]
MLKHIVMWKFKETAEGRTKAENIAMMHARLSALPPQISCILSFELGRDVCHTEKSYDMVLVSEFENVAKMLDEIG